MCCSIFTPNSCYQSCAFPHEKGCVDGLQGRLRNWQAYPIIGPVIFSPIKAIISLVQLVLGMLVYIFAKLAASLCCSKCCAGLKNKIQHVVNQAHHNMVIGLGELYYSLTNMATIGIVGYINVRPFRNKASG